MSPFISVNGEIQRKFDWHKETLSKCKLEIITKVVIAADK